MAINKNKLMSAAQKYIQKGQYEKALKEYNKIIDADPKDERIRLKAAELYARLGKKDEAVEHYRKVAESYSKQGFYVKAVAVYKQILKLVPDYLEGMMKLGELYQQLGLLSDATIQMQQVVERLEAAGKTDEALDILEQMTALDPENIQARLRYAQALVRAERRDEAIELYRTLAEELKGTDNFDEYLRILELLSQVDSSDHDLLRELAEIYINRGEIKRALTKLQVCFKEDPQNAETLLLLAEAFRSLGQEQKLLSVYHELVRVYESQGRHNERDAIYRKILSIDPEDQEARAALESTGQGTGDDLDGDLMLDDDFGSLEGFEEDSGAGIPTVMPADPGGFDAPTTLASDSLSGYDTKHDNGSAPAVPDPGAPVLEQDPDTEKRITETDVFLKYGLLDRAKAHIVEALQSNPGSIPLREKLVQVLEALEDKNGAAEELEKLIAMANRLGASDLVDKYSEMATRIAPGTDLSSGALNLVSSNKANEELDEDIIELDPDQDVEEFSLDETSNFESLDVEPEEEGFLMDGADREHDYVAGEELYGDSGVFDFEGAEGQGDVSGGPNEPNAFDFEPVESQDSTDYSKDEPSILGMSPEELLSEAAEQPESPGDVASTSGTESNAGVEVAYKDDDLSDELEEVRFYIQQNLFEDARSLLEEILSKAPEHPQAKALMAEVDLLGGDSIGDQKPEQPQEQTDDFGYDFAQETDITETRAMEHLEQEDHFDLGMAYFGMAMYDEAVREFKTAATAHDEREADCHKMIGLALSAQGKPREAIKAFKQGLKVQGATNGQRLDLYYELGNVLEGVGRAKDAKKCFARVYREDRKFRDVVQRLKKLAVPGGGQVT